MKNYTEILKQCPLFYGIAEEKLTALLSCLSARIIEYNKGESVFFEGDEIRLMGIVLEGSVYTEQTDYYGNRSILEQYTPSSIFGEAFAFGGVKSIPVSFTAREDSRVMLIDSGHILTTCSNACSFHITLIHNLVRELAEKNLRFHARSNITSKRTTRQKLLSYLMHCSKEQGSNSFTIPFDRQELADYLEVDRSGLSAEISKLRHEGVLESKKKHFVLK